MYPTMSELVGFWVCEYGSDHRDQQWVLSPYDSWHLNPFYRGPDQGHPEDDQQVFDYEETEESVSDPTALPFDDADFKFSDDYRELLFRCGITEKY